MEGLAGEVAEMEECWGQLERETMAKLGTMIADFQGNGDNLEHIVGDCQAVQAEWTAAHATLSRLGKSLEKVKPRNGLFV